jgi:2-oxoisovalerate dehydrogenase E2 component (dihydrolipoyl transacylase)
VTGADSFQALLDIDVPNDSCDEAQFSDIGLSQEIGSTQELTSRSQLPVEHETLPESSMPTGIPDTKAQQAPLTDVSSLTLIAPSLRRLLKENNINIKHVKGTGRDGIILKEDIMRYIESGANDSFDEQQAKVQPSIPTGAEHNDRRVTMSPIQTQMFKAMTSSLAIPHFLYTHKVDLTAIMDQCKRFKSDPSLALRNDNGNAIKLTPLPFIMKALSNAITEFPILNSTLDTSDSQKPALIVRGQHNFGMAVDSPKGLLVPVVRDVKHHSLLSLTAEITRVGQLARDGKLSPNDMIDGTIVASNIGSIGGQVVAPVILPPMVAIMAIGKVESEPVFEKDSDGVERLVRKKRATLSWSADHRVLDGATVARCAQRVQQQLEMPESLGLDWE